MYAQVIRLFQVFSKPVKKVGDKSVQVGPHILCFFQIWNRLCTYVCVTNYDIDMGYEAQAIVILQAAS